MKFLGRGDHVQAPPPHCSATAPLVSTQPSKPGSSEVRRPSREQSPDPGWKYRRKATTSPRNGGCRIELNISASEVLTCYVVPVDLPVQLLVGGAEVDGGGQLEHGLVQAVQVAVLGGVDQHGGAGQRRVEPVVGQILTLSARIEVMKLPTGCPYLWSTGREEPTHDVQPGHGVEAAGDDEGGGVEVELGGRGDAGLVYQTKRVHAVHRGQQEHAVHRAAVLQHASIIYHI